MYRSLRCLSNRWNTLTLVQFLFLKIEGILSILLAQNISIFKNIYQWKRLLSLRLRNLPGWSNLTSSIFSTWELYAVMWNTTSGESWIQVMFTGTKSSLTCVHLTVPELDVVTWKTSAQSRHIGMLSNWIFLLRILFVFYQHLLQVLCKTKYMNRYFLLQWWSWFASSEDICLSIPWFTTRIESIALYLQRSTWAR